MSKAGYLIELLGLQSRADGINLRGALCIEALRKDGRQTRQSNQAKAGDGSKTRNGMHADKEYFRRENDYTCLSRIAALPSLRLLIGVSVRLPAIRHLAESS